MMPDCAVTPQECRWELSSLEFAGLAWGPEDGTPVLALHGWMDHAASFQELAPRFNGCRVVALDLSGHGLSGHRAAHATYNIWDDLPQIAELMDQLGWDDCVLLGHSRGANISALFAAAQPDRVRALVVIESLAPEPTETGAFVSTLRAFVAQTRKQNARPPRTFATRADYVDRRCAQGNSRHTAEALADRALEEGADGFRLRGDPRLFASSAVKLTRMDVETVLRSLQCPVLNIWATDGLGRSRPWVADLIRVGEEAIQHYERMDVAGDHHLHLDATAAAEIARAALNFLQRPHCR